MQIEAMLSTDAGNPSDLTLVIEGPDLSRLRQRHYFRAWVVDVGAFLYERLNAGSC